MGRLRTNAVQLVLLTIDALPHSIVARPCYLFLRRQLSSTPIRFSPSGPSAAERAPEEWPGRRFVSRDTDLVVDGFPGSANSFVSNALRQSLVRPANIESHFHYTAQLRGALALGIPAIVIVRHPAEACRSLLGKEPELWSWLIVWRWLLYHQWVLRHRNRVTVVLFDQVTEDIDSLRRDIPAVAQWVEAPLEGSEDLQRTSWTRAELSSDHLTQRLLQTAENRYERLATEATTAD